ncbi:MAG: hypothetical protein QMC39_08280 [Flavobacteriales bacterium]|jgi:hypothetical protein|tara:strand:+ start:3484 stop:4107 length:624 start_codon:yes stop_codon:yes gene_type:complete
MTLQWLTALIFIGISSIINGQPALNDTIFFMNGDILQCDIIDDSQIEVVFEFQKRKRRKQLGVHKSEIFGIINNGVKEIYYEENEIVGDDLTISEVEVYLAGQRDARELYKTKKIFYTGLGVTLAISIAGEAGLLAVTVPLLIYPAAQYIPYIKIKGETIVNPNHKFNLIYAEGYEGVARGKRVMAALKGSAAGTVIGAFFYRLVLQ